MTRTLALALTASTLSFWTLPSHANGTLVQANSFYPPAHAWPRVDHAPAITKKLRHAPLPHSAQPPAQAYEYEWQHQPAPSGPSLTPHRFSHPQQGYYPRDGQVQQPVPGYEYDFGGAATFPPTYPMEGAKWRAPRAAKQEYAHCSH